MESLICNFFFNMTDQISKHKCALHFNLDLGGSTNTIIVTKNGKNYVFYLFVSGFRSPKRLIL